jgi:hypothetical protein
MKKLLVLLLIIGMASAANAAIMISVDGDTSQEEIDLLEDDTAVIGVYVTDAVYYEAFLTFASVSEGGFELSNETCLWPPPVGIPPMPPDDFELYEIVPPPGWTPVPGLWFTVDLTCMSAGVDVIVCLIDPQMGDLIDMLIIHQVPEPTTLALLGLGGLLALRRRKCRRGQS